MPLSEAVAAAAAFLPAAAAADAAEDAAAAAAVPSPARTWDEDYWMRFYTKSNIP